MNTLLGIDTIAFTIGNIDIAWYGIIVTTGIICAFLFFLHMGKQQGLILDFTLETFIWVPVLAVIFCRLFYVIPRLGTEYTTFIEVINIRNGGLTIVGGIFGGLLGILISVLKNRQYHFVRVSDAAALPVLIGQIIGRWGNFFNQELFGLEITNPSFQKFPFAVYIENPARFYSGCQPGWYCALFFYEGVLNAIGLIVAYSLYRKFKDKFKPGTVSLFYLTWYGLVRGSLEFLKIDHVTIGDSGIGSIQVICYVMAAVGIVLLALLYTNKIHFESKKFDDIIVAHTAKMQAKLAANQPKVGVVEEAQPNVDENKEEINNNDEPLVQETTVSSDSATNEDKIADDKEIKE